MKNLFEIIIEAYFFYYFDLEIKFNKRIRRFQLIGLFLKFRLTN